MEAKKQAQCTAWRPVIVKINHERWNGSLLSSRCHRSSFKLCGLYEPQVGEHSNHMERYRFMQGDEKQLFLFKRMTHQGSMIPGLLPMLCYLHICLK